MQLNTKERDPKDTTSETTARMAQFTIVDPFQADNPLAQMLDKPDFNLDDALSLILNLDFNPNTVNSKGDTLLHILVRDRLHLFATEDYSGGYYRGTVYYSDTYIPSILENLKKLKSKTANFNLKNKEQKSPLQIILDSTHPEAGLYLVQLGADVNTKNSKGQTLLHLFTESFLNTSRHVEWQSRVACLIKTHGANINEPDGNGLTVYQLLLERGCTTPCMFLLQLGANINARNSKGQSLLTVLLEGNTHTYMGYDEWQGAVYGYTNDSLIREVLHKSAQLPGQEPPQQTTLRSVLESGQSNPQFIHNAMLLIELGALVNTTNSKGETLYSILEANNQNGVNQKTMDQLLKKYTPEQLGGIYGRKKRILAPLEAYAGKAFGLSAFWHKNNDRAQALIKAIMNTNDLKVIGALLRSQLDLFSQSNRAASASSSSSSSPSPLVPAAATASSSPIDARFNQNTTLPEQMKGYGDMSKESGFFKAVADAFKILGQIMIEDNPALAETGELSEEKKNSL